MKTPRHLAIAAPLLLALAAGIAVAQEAKEPSVRPGINEKFLDPKLDVTEWLDRFEVESREIYAERREVVKTCGIAKGDVVADIGAGTGLFTRLFAEATGPEGAVFAVEINPRWLEHINRTAEKAGLANITSVLGRENSVTLPPDSTDLAFICDTYHHFEYPKSTLASILSALKKGGNLVVIDFERIPGVSREWTLGHVRAGKEVFREEILATGFEFVEEIKIPGFKENYFLRFRKP